ncbi:hypothetical protein ACLESO_43755 [Pyxidicoccus sp. 3LG]
MNTFLRAVSVVGASLAMAACGGDLASEEPMAPEADALVQAESELGSCANWSQWIANGSYTCDANTSCGSTWQCIPGLRGGDDTASLQGGDGEPDEFIPTCDPGYVLVRVGNPGRYNQEYSYRACFNEAGTYTHTEYQYRYVAGVCGC